VTPVSARGPAVVVSPHLDDAVLSAWTFLAGHPGTVVVTCFAGVPTVGTPPSEWDLRTGAADPSARALARRCEDVAALTLLGARPVHLDFQDGAYRPAAADDDVPDRLVTALRPLLAEAGQVLAPAAFGGHPDHLLARHAALAASPPGRTRLYADLPYAARWGWPSWVRGWAPLRRCVRRARRASPARDPDREWARILAGLSALAADVHRLTPTERADKQRALACYASQLPSLGLDGPGSAALAYEVSWSRA
jgi:LmbE family N-acetylglucosaminyl deacetylase